MESFKKYHTQMTEGVLGNLKNHAMRLIGKFKKLLSNLQFGKSVEISLIQPSTLSEAKTDQSDLKSRMGYYSELCVAESLLHTIVNELPDNVKGTPVADISRLKTEYRNNKLLDTTIVWSTKVNASKLTKEIKRQEESGDVLGLKIWDDIKISTDDILFCDFEVVLTGESGKGITKADIKLVVTKRNTNEVIDTIKASLKVYKSWNINVANSTFISWIINLIEPSMGGFGNKGSLDAKMLPFIKKHGKKDQIEQLIKLQRFGDGIKKTQGRAVAKKAVDDNRVYFTVRNIMIDIFTSAYKTNKDKINQNMLTLLGFDGADDMYLAVQTAAGKKIEVLSTRTSKEFKKMLDKLRAGFDIRFNKSDTIVNTGMSFFSGDDLLFVSNFGFRDLSKVSNFVNVSQFK